MPSVYRVPASVPQISCISCFLSGFGFVFVGLVFLFSFFLELSFACFLFCGFCGFSSVDFPLFCWKVHPCVPCCTSHLLSLSVFPPFFLYSSLVCLFSLWVFRISCVPVPIPRSSCVFCGLIINTVTPWDPQSNVNPSTAILDDRRNSSTQCKIKSNQTPRGLEVRVEWRVCFLSEINHQWSFPEPNTLDCVT